MKIAAKRIVTTAMLVAFLVVAGAGPALAQGHKVNINTATLEELCILKRVGPTYAQRIVDYRNEYGSFQNPEDIIKVRGIGNKTYEANKDIITCE